MVLRDLLEKDVLSELHIFMVSLKCFQCKKMFDVLTNTVDCSHFATVWQKYQVEDLVF